MSEPDLRPVVPAGKGGRRSSLTPLVYLLLIVFAVTTTFPLLWVVGAAFRPSDEITRRPLRMFPDPRQWTFSPRLRARDIMDWPGFCAKLRDQAAAAEPSPGARLWSRLPADARTLVSNVSEDAPPGEEQESDLVEAISAALRSRDLYSEEAFETVAVPDEAKDILRTGVQEAPERKVVRLNRLLLQAAYAREIREMRGPFDNFRKALSIVPFARFFLNSLLIALVVTAGQVTTSACAAYAFARLRFPGRDRIFLGYLGTMMVPWTVVMIPTFVMMKVFGWIDTYWALTLPAMFSAYGTFMLRQFFLGIPREYEEAAKIDGCGYAGIFWHVILPLSRPALATLALFTFIGSWNNLIAPLVFIVSEEKMTLPLGLTRFQGLRDTDWGALMAGSLMMLVPMLILFAIGQRFFTRGIRLSTGKG